MNTLHSLHAVATPIGARGTTVRRGTKWHRAVKRGDWLVLCECGPDGDHDLVGTAIVIDTHLDAFYHITARALRDEHETRSRGYNGLLASMRRAYGNSFDESSMCTVLDYRRTT